MAVSITPVLFMRRLVVLSTVALLLAPSAYGYYDSAGGSQISLPVQDLSSFPAESISLPSAILGLNDVDIRIPGPNGMDLVLKRRYTEWWTQLNHTGFGPKVSIDVPRIRFTASSPSTDFGCIGVGKASFFMPEGRELRTVGVSSSSHMPAGATLLFDGHEAYGCESGKPVLWLPNGTKMTLGQSWTTLVGSTLWLPTKHEDRFGNRIDYNYSVVDGDPVITSITRTDGASISLTYANVGSGNYRITQATYGTRTVSYAYTNGVLTKVTDEVGRTTEYGRDSIGVVFSVDLPTGATVSYGQFPTPSGYRRLTSRTISGPYLDTLTTTFHRVGLGQYWGHAPDIPDRLYVKVIDEDVDGTKDRETEYYFFQYDGTIQEYDNGTMARFGQLAQINRKLDGQLQYRLVNQVGSSVAGTIGCSYGIGDYYIRRNCGRSWITESEHTLFVGGVASDTWTTEYLTHDRYGFAEEVKEYTEAGAFRFSKTELFHNMTHWLIGLPYKKERSANGTSWTTYEQVGYHSSSGAYKSQPYYFYRHGSWVHRNTSYHSTGELQRVDYNGTNRYEIHASYKYGTARSVTVPKRYGSGTRTLTRVVDNYGNVTSETDYNGEVIRYEYDGLNRRTKIDPLDQVWTDTTFDYYDSSRYRHERRGNFRGTEWWDGLGRIYRSRTQDNTNTADTRAYTWFDYDKLGRLEYRSFPSSSSVPTKSTGLGTEYEYDGLDRMTRSYTATTGTDRTWSYGSGHSVTITDGNGNVTTTDYQSYGSPSYTLPLVIAQPEGVTTSVSYNIWEAPVSISQGGITESFIYDSKQRLCKRIRPDIGKIGFGYNSQNQIAWRAHGSSGSSTACGGESSGDKITYTYDNRSDLRQLSLPGGAIYRKVTLDDVGNLTQMESQWGVWTYLYNSAHLLEKETLTVNGRTFSLDWAYNALGHRSSLTYPNGLVVDYAPNAVGQPTKAGTFATTAKYHETGSLEGYTYGNGITRSVTFDAAGTPSEIKDFLGSSRRFEHDYAWDNERNLIDLWDRHNSVYHVESITYDGLHRLKTGNGQWGSTLITYDNRNNIQSMQLGTQTTNHLIGTTNNRLYRTTGDHARKYSYDSRGNIVSNTIHSLTYNLANQLTRTRGATAYGNDRYYEYDGYGRRIEKRVVNGSTRNFVYGMDGKLYHKAIVDGEATDYVYLSDTHVARKDSGAGNVAPTAFNDSYTVSGYNEPFTFSPLSNDNDPDGDLLVITSVSNSQVSIEPGGTTLYYPGSSSDIEFTFTYTISDGNGGTDSAQYTLEVEDD